MLANIFISLFSVVGILIGVTYLKKQRIDDYRTDLFTLRHELFMLGARKEIDFNSTTYRYLEKKINGSIRFAHKVNYPFLLITMFVFKYKKIDFEKNGVEEEKILNMINNKELRKKVNKINNQMSSSLFRYLFKSSWLFKINIIVLFMKNVRLNPDIKTQVKNKKIQNITDTLAFEHFELENEYGLAF